MGRFRRFRDPHHPLPASAGSLTISCRARGRLPNPIIDRISKAVILSVRPRGANLAQVTAGPKDPAADGKKPGRGSGRDAEVAIRPPRDGFGRDGRGFPAGGVAPAIVRLPPGGHVAAAARSFGPAQIRAITANVFPGLRMTPCVSRLRSGDPDGRRTRNSSKTARGAPESGAPRAVVIRRGTEATSPGRARRWRAGRSASPGGRCWRSGRRRCWRWGCAPRPPRWW